MITGFIAGAFDIFHPGYLDALERAKKECDFLIVALHIDPSIERPEKPKPLFLVSERKDMLYALRCVDLVVEYETEAELNVILGVLRPHIRFLGEDYREHPENITGMYCSKRIHYLPRSHGWSETKVRKMLKETI